MNDVRKDIEYFLELAKEDEDEWVRMVAHMLASATQEKTVFPSMENSEIFKKTIQELEQKSEFPICIIEFIDDLDFCVLMFNVTVDELKGPLQIVPSEYLYLSSKLVTSIPEVLKINPHFKLKEKSSSVNSKEQINLQRKRPFMVSTGFFDSFNVSCMGDRFGMTALYEV